VVDSRFHYLDDLVWSFPVGSEFSGFPFLSVFEHLSEDQIFQFEGAGLNLLVVIAFDLMLVVLDSKQCLVASRSIPWLSSMFCGILERRKLVTFTSAVAIASTP